MEANNEKPTFKEPKGQHKRARYTSEVPFHYQDAITSAERGRATRSGTAICIHRESPLSEGLEKAAFPPQFRMIPVPKFKGDTDPRQFLMTYEATINSAGGGEVALAKAFACALEGPTLTWYFNLPAKSIYSWKNLRDKVTNSIRAFRLVTDPKHALKDMTQQPKEALASYYKRFLTLRNQSPIGHRIRNRGTPKHSASKQASQKAPSNDTRNV